MDIRMLTVGQVAENTYIFRQDDSDTALIVDPGEEPERILGTLDQLGISKQLKFEVLARQ